MAEAGRRNQLEPIRLFKSDFLEFFSHISPVTVLVIWVPVILAFLTLTVLEIPRGAIPLYALCGLAGGWFIWSLTEYFMHRFIFHYHPRTEKLKKLFFTVHGVHHAQPMCRTRLVMPPALSVPLALVFYGVFTLVISVIIREPLWLYPTFAGLLIGYVIYDLTHYALHHAKLTKGYLAMCRYQHMQHHGTCPNMRFGVSVPWWDYVFGTMPLETAKKKAGPTP